MKRGHQRCALSAKSNIATTEIADHRDARLRHNLVVIADLQGVRGIADGFMPDRLSVTPDGHHILRTKMFFLHQSLHRIRKQRPGMSVIVATAYMDEAQRFDWLVAMDDGAILATGTPAQLLERTGAVSCEVAEAMASGARTALGVDIAVSTTGGAGPEPHDGKPVGTVYLGVAGPDGSAVHALVLAGDRAAVRAAAVRAALDRLRAAITLPANSQ